MSAARSRRARPSASKRAARAAEEKALRVRVELLEEFAAECALPPIGATDAQLVRWIRARAGRLLRGTTVPARIARIETAAAAWLRTHDDGAEPCPCDLCRHTRAALQPTPAPAVEPEETTL